MYKRLILSKPFHRLQLKLDLSSFHMPFTNLKNNPFVEIDLIWRNAGDIPVGMATNSNT